MVQIDKALLEILVCPQTKAPLVLVGDWLYSTATDPQARRKYPVRDGIPIMLIEEAQAVSPEEHERIMAQTGDGGGPVPADGSE